MHPFFNMTAIGSDTDPAQFQAMLEASTIAVAKNNEGNAARARGDLATAERLHLQALQLKIRGFGDESVQPALSYNTLGETYLKMGKLDKVERNLKKALRCATGASTAGSPWGPAATRPCHGTTWRACSRRGARWPRRGRGGSRARGRGRLCAGRMI